jgi:hypothetical protein
MKVYKIIKDKIANGIIPFESFAQEGNGKLEILKSF